MGAMGSSYAGVTRQGPLMVQVVQHLGRRFLVERPEPCRFLDHAQPVRVDRKTALMTQQVLGCVTDR